MKTVIVYYSLEGNTDYASKIISAESGAETLRLVPKKHYRDKGLTKYLFGSKSAVMGEQPELEDYFVDLPEFDRVVLGFPVWASNVSPPLRTFIEQNREALKGKRMAAFACQRGSGAVKAFKKLKEFLGIDAFEFEEVFIDPKDKRSDSMDDALRAFGEKLRSE